MRRLPSFAALRCETDDGKKCACRCGGKFHGENRATTLEGLKTVPYGDPHKTPDLSGNEIRAYLLRVQLHVLAYETPTRGTLRDFEAHSETLRTLKVLIYGNKVARSREAKRTAPPIRVGAAANAERHHD